jgi:hypothetical protein
MPVSRGEGVIVRLYTPALPESTVVVAAHHFKVTGTYNSTYQSDFVVILR